MMTHDPKHIKALAELVREHRNAGKSSEEIARAVLDLIKPKPLDWSKKTAESLDDGIKLHLGPYSVRLWSGKLGARLDYLGQPLAVETTANGFSAAIKAAAEAHHVAAFWVMSGIGGE